MRYLQFYTTLLLIFGATCLCWLGLVTLLPCAPSESLVWWHDTYARKIAYAHRTPGRRVLLTAGSSGAFSLSAAELTRRSGVPAVNMALYAGLGLRVILRQTMKVARRGDLVVLPLEYEQYQGTLEEGPDSIGYKLAWEPLTLIQGHGFGAVNAVLAMPVERVYNRLLWQLVPQHMGPGHQIGIQINEAGDIVTNWPHHRDASALGRLKDPLPSAFLQHGTAVAPTAATALTEFVAWCRARGVTVVATYPAIMDSPAYHQPGRCRILPVLRTFYAGLGVPLLGDPKAFMLDRTKFFDAIYHLDHAAQLANTHQLAQLLGPYMRAMKQPGQRLASTLTPEAN
jgi:hypothetical protein